MESKRLIMVEEDGDLRAFVGRPHDGMREFVGRYRPIASSSQLLILRREAGAALDEAAGRILMAGEIFYRNTVLEVVSVIVSSRWAGTLHIYGPRAHRMLGFDRAALRFAQSDDPEDRLNKILFRLGVLSPAESEEVERGPRSDQRFGESLVRKGMMDEKQLYGYLQKQMEEIFASAILERRGCYLFSVEDDWASAADVTVHIPMQQLLFDGASRLDRFTEFEKLIPDEGLCPVIRAGVEVTQLQPGLRRVLGFCDGRRTVRDLFRETWLGRFQTMSAIYDLLRRECIELRAPQRSFEEAANLLARPFDEALHEIAGAVEAKGDVERVHRELQRWSEQSELGQYLGDVVTPGLSLDVAQVVRALEELGVRDREEIVRHALHELVSFGLFAASLSLPRDEERQLARRVQERLG